jgi:FkbM family methyltransferase
VASFHEVERAEYAFYLSYLRPGMTVCDAGANVGELTVLFSRFVGPEGAVHAFEPVPSTFERLTAVIDAGARTNVVLNRVALAAESGFVTMNLYDDEHLSWSTVVQRPRRPGGADVLPVRREVVPALRLDDYCAREAIDRVDLLKIDVEGAELDVLRGAESLLRSRGVACCVFEFGATTLEHGVDPSTISAYLAACGYSLRNIVEHDPVFPGAESVETATFSMHVATPR